MSAFRSFIACLLMLALPLQGFAAASMLQCKGAITAASTAVVDHSQHAGHSGHDGHVGHVGHDKAKPSSAHSCAACAYCCHAVALTEFPQAQDFGRPVHAGAAEPAVLIVPRTIRVPDKPPRA